MYRLSERASDNSARTEEVYADGWRVDYDKVVLFQMSQDGANEVFDIPKQQVMRIQELGS
jgi:hypothetical protein